MHILLFAVRDAYNRTPKTTQCLTRQIKL